MRIGIVVIFAVLMFVQGCGASCGIEREFENTTYEGGTTDGGIYTSSEWNGPWAHFPAGRTIDFKHALGVMPQFVSTYVSFKEAGIRGDDSASENAGNQGLIRCVDTQTIRIYNDTCAEFYIRVVAISTQTGEQSVEPCN